MKTTTTTTTTRPLNTPGRRARTDAAAAVATRIGLLTALAIAVSTSPALAGGGSLSVSPAIVEHTATPGGIGAIKIANTTSSAMRIQIALRPWTQARNGEVSSNRAATLSEARPTTSSFTLNPGASRTVGMILTRRPAGRSQYGAIEVTGTPTRKATSGINVAYRLISSLRLDAPRGAQSFHAQAGALSEQGSVKQGTLLLAVRNAGNTIAPIGGTVRVNGQNHSLRANATAKGIIPGASVNVPLTQLLGSLPKGRYAVSVTLTQAGRNLGTVNRTIGLR